MKFKVGDKVQTLVVEDKYGFERFPVGAVGCVGHIDTPSKDLPYCIFVDGESYWYGEKELQIVGNDMLFKNRSDILEVLDEMKEFTVGEPLSENVHMTVDELLYYINRISEIIRKEENTK
jgi:hypothetical protein